MTPYYQDESVTIYHGDCRELLPTLEQVSVTLTDPPYGVNLDYASHDDHFLMEFGWLTLCRSLSPCVIVTPGYVNTFKYPIPDALAQRVDA